MRPLSVNLNFLVGINWGKGGDREGGKGRKGKNARSCGGEINPRENALKTRLIHRKRQTERRGNRGKWKKIGGKGNFGPPAFPSLPWAGPEPIPPSQRSKIPNSHLFQPKSSPPPFPNPGKAQIPPKIAAGIFAPRAFPEFPALGFAGP